MFAAVHAESEREAVRIACEKTDGREPSECNAIVVFNAASIPLGSEVKSRH